MELTTVTVPMKDGVGLSTDIYFPRGGHKGSALLIRTPYGKRRMYSLPVLLARYGFIVLMQDVRGRYWSGGNYVFATRESSDGVETVEWIRNQTWFDGKLGLIGPSYCGWAGLSATDLRKNLFDAIMLVAAPYDWYNVVFPSGVLQLHWAYPWASAMSGAGACLSKLKKWPEEIYGPSVLDTWLEHREYDHYWESRAIRFSNGPPDCPILHIGGWYDFILYEVLRGWSKLSGRTNNRLIIGPWSHHTLLNSASHLLDVEFGSHSELNLTDLAQKWFTACFSNCLQAAFPFQIKLFVTGKCAWSNRHHWNSSGKQLRLHTKLAELSGGTPKTQSQSLCYTSSNPVPTLGGTCWPLPAVPGLNPGPALQNGLRERNDVAHFFTKPLNQRVTCLGPASARLVVDASSPVHIIVNLVENSPTGMVRLIAESEPAVLEKGRQIVNIDFNLVAHELNVGCEIGFLIKCGSFPRYERILHDGEVVIYHGGDGSYLQLTLTDEEISLSE